MAEDDFADHGEAIAWVATADGVRGDEVQRVEYLGPEGDWRWAGALHGKALRRLPTSPSVHTGLSVEEVEVLTSRLHRMDQQLVAAVEAQDDDLEQPTRGVEAETELPCRAVVVHVAEENGMLGGMDRVVGSYAVPLC